MPWSARPSRATLRQFSPCWALTVRPSSASGDPVADTNVRQNFIAAYDAKHAIELEGNGTQTLILGNDNWPFPIPLDQQRGQVAI